jgi:ferredoxin-type protein NapF
VKQSLHRRHFLTGQIRPAPNRPPWLTERALDACDGCGACVEACPSALLRTIRGAPEISFTSECTLCGKCAAACPKLLFDQSLRPFNHVVAIGESCLARSGTVCQSCRDVCPEMAIHFAPRRGGPFLPKVQADACTGCGACIAICPVSAITISPRAEVSGA